MELLNKVLMTVLLQMSSECDFHLTEFSQFFFSTRDFFFFSTRDISNIHGSENCTAGKMIPITYKLSENKQQRNKCT